MIRRLEGKVAVITGAARGQGRSHAVRLAQEGAKIIAIDLCANVESVGYGLATASDLAETAEAVRTVGGDIVVAEADVRDLEALEAAVDLGYKTFGRLDIVSANAGVFAPGTALETGISAWKDVLDIDLTGVWYTAKACAPRIIEGGRGGAIVITNSAAGLRAMDNMVHYTSAKHGLVGLMRALALELATHSIRVNSLHPTTVPTGMVLNQSNLRLFRPDLAAPSVEDVHDVFVGRNALPTPWVEPIDVSNALMFLVSDEARYITGATIPIDAGHLLK
jgi:SDR family mycofactocin-dependent oxidoreductase